LPSTSFLRDCCAGLPDEPTDTLFIEFSYTRGRYHISSPQEDAAKMARPIADRPIHPFRNLDDQSTTRFRRLALLSEPRNHRLPRNPAVTRITQLLKIVERGRPIEYRERMISLNLAAGLFTAFL